MRRNILVSEIEGVQIRVFCKIKNEKVLENEFLNIVTILHRSFLLIEFSGFPYLVGLMDNGILIFYKIHGAPEKVHLVTPCLVFTGNHNLQSFASHVKFWSVFKL